MRIAVRVVPNAKKERVLEEPGQLKIYLRAPANEGKANKALIALLADYYKVKKSAVRIVHGEKSRDKLVEIAGV